MSYEPKKIDDLEQGNTMHKIENKDDPDYINGLEPSETHRRGSVFSIGHGSKRRLSISDDVFGEITEEGPNYRNVGWMGTVVVMIKTQIGLGVLSIPAAFDALGMVPGVICLLLTAGIITWGNYMIGRFKTNHPEVYSIVDVGYMLFGPIGREIFCIIFLLYWICVAASGFSSISTAFNALSLHGACTAIFVVVAAIFGFLTSSIRTLGKISWLAWVGVVSIIVALLTLTIAVGVQERPAAAPQTGPYVSDYKVVGNPTFVQAMGAINSLVFSYSGTPGFFAIISEMRNPKDYNKAMFTCQGVMTAVYLVVGIVVYYYCGSFVASPALGSAGPLLKRVCYGLALPGLIVSTCIVSHYPAKYIFLRIMKGSKHLVSNSKTHWATWLSCTAGVTIIAYIICSAVPNFGSLISLVGALFATFMSMQPLAMMWLYDNFKGRSKNVRWICGTVFSVFVIAIGTYIMGAGAYAAVIQIINDYKVSNVGAWSCADNSNSAGGGH